MALLLLDNPWLMDTPVRCASRSARGEWPVMVLTSERAPTQTQLSPKITAWKRHGTNRWGEVPSFAGPVSLGAGGGGAGGGLTSAPSALPVEPSNILSVATDCQRGVSHGPRPCRSRELLTAAAAGSILKADGFLRVQRPDPDGGRGWRPGGAADHGWHFHWPLTSPRAVGAGRGTGSGIHPGDGGRLRAQESRRQGTGRDGMGRDGTGSSIHPEARTKRDETTRDGTGRRWEQRQNGLRMALKICAASKYRRTEYY